MLEKGDNIRNVECSLLRKLRKKQKEDLDDYKRRRLITVGEKKQCLRKCGKELLMYRPTEAPLGREDGIWVTDRTEREI